MNLSKLFETQKVLRDRINYNKEDRFNKLILALLVEIGECANEWRGFKYWSKNQNPRMKAERKVIQSGLESFDNHEGAYEWVPYNPLLEEYVDGLHFVLEICLELGVRDPFEPDYEENVTEQFRTLYYHASRISGIGHDSCEYAVSYFLGLGEMLGFTWEQIEEAYYKKNQINHDRQDNGY